MFFILLIYYRVLQKACGTRGGLFEIPEKIAKIRISIYTLYRPHTLDDDEGERNADRDPKSDGDESAAIPAQHQAVIFARFVEEQWDPREAAPVYSQSYQLSAV